MPTSRQTFTTKYTISLQENYETMEKKKKVGNYLLGHVIGEGAFSKVRQGLHIIAREKVAVKIVPKKALLLRDYLKKNIRREVIMLQRLEHQNIIRLYEIMETSNSYYLVMELAGGGEFIKYLAGKKILEELECRKFMREIASALDHMHISNIVHRDLRLENLLLDDSMNIKLVDFGLSNVFYGDCSLQTQCGSPAYAAPEIFCNRKYGPAVDVWSLGVCMFAMLTGELPFVPTPSNNFTQLHSNISKGCTIPEGISEECADLLRRMLLPDDKQRIKVDDILVHPWMRHGYEEPIITRQPPTGKLFPPIPKGCILNYMTKVFHFMENDVFYSVIERKVNSVAAAYHLLQKRFDKGLHMIGFSLDMNGASLAPDHRGDEDARASAGSKRTEVSLSNSSGHMPVNDLNMGQIAGLKYKKYLDMIKDSKERKQSGAMKSSPKDVIIARQRTRTTLNKPKKLGPYQTTADKPEFILTYDENDGFKYNTSKYEWDPAVLVSKDEKPKEEDRSYINKKGDSTKVGDNTAVYDNTDFSMADTGEKHESSGNISKEPQNYMAGAKMKHNPDIAPKISKHSINHQVSQYPVQFQSQPQPNISKLSASHHQTIPSVPTKSQHSPRSPLKPKTSQLFRSENYTWDPLTKQRTLAIDDQYTVDAWHTFNKQKARLARGATFSLARSKTLTYSSPISCPKELTPREAKAFYEEIQQAQVVGTGRRLTERVKISPRDDTFASWHRNLRTASGNRQFPELVSAGTSRPQTQCGSIREVDVRTILSLPGVNDSQDRFMPSPPPPPPPSPPPRQTMVDGVMPIIKVEITASARI
ncbi:hypothetical protein CHS0354_027958 [Potamilus streckersoni]|uniref:non-specific serine/threonine protein kinase n=1 Tax=Potamilus streckersoni TaxID=2493646 RepID=A0AAE0T497_9BIVA|nr:hypothetical protein CHS0354_027958 [Potamilus streckersoni]